MFKCNKTKLFISAISLILISLSFGVNTNAQDVSTGQATATVLAVLAVTAPSNLVFGDVLQGVVKAVPRTDANAGIFNIAGEGTNNEEISMHLQLPDFLWNSGVGVQDRMVIAFSATDCTIDTTSAGTPAVPGAGAQVGEDPQNLPDTGMGGDDDVVRIYLGGTVNPAPDQRAGSYTADIILTAAYTGD